MAGALAATYWFDQRVIDGVVDGGGAGDKAASPAGSAMYSPAKVQWYAAALFLGVIGLAVVVTQLIGS